MSIQKEFRFDGGWSLTAEVQGHALRFTVRRDDWSLPLTAEDSFTFRSFRTAAAPESPAYLLGDRVSAEDLGDCLLLHFSPYDALRDMPTGAMMVHWRLEKAGANALRVTAWLGCREPVQAARFSWLSLRTDKAAVEGVAGFDPDHVYGVSELTHSVRFGSAALLSGGHWVMLTDCGEALWTPNIGGYEDVTEQCMLSAMPGQLLDTDISFLDEAHPLTAVLAFGDGEPTMPQARSLTLPVPQPAAGTRYTLRSGRLTAAILAQENGVSLCGVDLDGFAPDGTAGLSPLTCLNVLSLRDGTVIPITAEHDWARVRVEASEKRLCVWLDRPLGIALSVSVEARAVPGDCIEWRVRVINDDDAYSVLSVTWPAVCFSGANGADLFRPAESGAVTHDACAHETRWQGTWPSGFSGVVPVLGVYDPAKRSGSGLYAAIHAPQAARIELDAVFCRNGQGAFRFEYPAENLGKPCNSFSPGGVLVTKVLDGDWYDMARIYGDYVHSCAEWCPPVGREDSPAWMRDVPMYIMDWMPNDNPAADPVPISVRPPVEPPRDNWYKKPIELADRLGLPIGYHLYNWHFIPFNNDYPDYFPVKEGLEEGVRAMHEHGVHVMPYINGRIVDTRDMHGSTAGFDRRFRAGATKRPDGGLDLERYAAREPDGTLCELAAMCPSAPVWRRTLLDIVTRLFRDYHMDAVYIDQVAAARVNLCCDPAHPHTPGNGTWWVRAYRLLMEQLRQECPEGCGFTTESNAECYADQFDGFLTWAWVDTDMVPFFPKVYAGRIAMLGRNTNGYKKTDAQYCRFHIGQAVMYGQQIGWINADVADDPEKIDYLYRMCHMRWDTRDFYSRGEMLRPPVVRGGQTFLSDAAMGHSGLQPADTVLAAGWRLDDEVLLAVTNTGSEAADVTVGYDEAEYGALTAPKAASYGVCALKKRSPGLAEAHLEPQSCLTLRCRAE